jgi:hypothetical protein
MFDMVQVQEGNKQTDLSRPFSFQGEGKLA